MGDDRVESATTTQQTGFFPGECVECGTEVESFDEAVIFEFELHCRDCGEPRIKIANVPNQDRRPTYVKIETIFNSSEEAQCRVCSQGVRKPFKYYCSGYCKSIAENIYKFFNWTYIRGRIKERDGRECVRCGDGDALLEVDHITPISKGGHPFDPKNLQTLCEDCHQEKGLSERDFRGEGTIDKRVEADEFEQTVLTERFK